MPHLFSSLLLCLAVSITAACGSYDLTINEKLVYSPKPPFSDYLITDPALQSCVELTIRESKVSSAVNLETLNCSYAGVTELKGLETFSGITKLKLSSNRVRSIATLTALSKLEVLHLADNQIVDLIPLLELQALRELDVSGNPELLCSSANGLIAVESLTLPQHCL